MVVAAWVQLGLFPYTYVALRKLLGKLGWLGMPGNHWLNLVSTFVCIYILGSFLSLFWCLCDQ